MRLLIIEQNQNLSQVIHSVASGEGHEVMLATSGDQALRIFCQRPADVVLGALELGDEDGLGVLRRLRAAPMGGEPQVILTSAYRRRYDPAVQTAMAELSAREFLSQPFSVLDFMDSLRRLADAQASHRAAAATTRSPMGSVSVGQAPRRLPEARNLARLARLWRSRATGVVRVEGDGGMSKGWITLKAGGPVHGGDWALIEGLLYSDDLVFDRAAVDGQGDWLGLGRLLFEAARDPSQTRYAEGHLYEALVSTAPAEMIGLLPLSAATQRVVEQSDGTLTLGELIARAGVGPDTLGEELYALQQLRLIALQPPLARAHRSGESGERPRVPRESARERVNRPPRSVSVSTQTATATGVAEDASHSLVSRTLTQTRQSSSRDASRSASRSVAHSRARGVQDPVRVAQRLIQELERLQDERPAVILGVPGDATRELMLASTNRMRRRYALLMEDPGLSAAGREAAASLKTLVESAYRRLRQGRNQPLSVAGSAPVIDADSLLREGQRLLRLEEWDMADQLLSRAHQKDSFRSSILAHLGWARYHNATRGEGRIDEGRDFVLLALEFDPVDADTLFFLASIRLQDGDLLAVRDVLRRAVVLHPTDARFPRLARQLPTDSVTSR